MIISITMIIPVVISIAVVITTSVVITMIIFSAMRVFGLATLTATAAGATALSRPMGGVRPIGMLAKRGHGQRYCTEAGQQKTPVHPLCRHF
ncbi:hypothetical protein [Roseovarius marisflavi]|uniref:hypothetical protein n=1 Tax=Roseovarius marisflavi TaxID=1054996 RepID=UPI0011149C67|nr:hypothetical protein [Roseovarius marisflavi]